MSAWERCSHTKPLRFSYGASIYRKVHFVNPVVEFGIVPFKVGTGTKSNAKIHYGVNGLW